MSAPHIIFIVGDDHGFGDLSSFGGPNVRTPNVDRMVEHGLKLTGCYANSPVCSPSRAALLTGRYPDRVGVPGVIRTDPDRSWGYFAQEAVTLPEVLGRGGYFTAHVGKWHLGLEPENHPCRRGFHLFRGFLGDMMDDYYTHRRHGHNYMRYNETAIDPQGHATDLFTEWAVETIHQQARHDRPLFLYLAYNAPHTPIQPPTDWFDRVRAREPGVTEQRARYIALVEHLDHGVGRVIEALAETGADRNALVVYSSDNGGQLDAGAYNGPLRGGKQLMYEGGIRVPCCAVWPGHISAGSETDQVEMLMDLFPTACEAAGVTVEHRIDGRSLLPLLHGSRDEGPERSLYWVRREGGAWQERLYLGRAYHAVRRGSLKLLHNDAFSPLEAYDLAVDEEERRNLVADPLSEVDELTRFMQDQVRAAGAVPWQPPARV